MADNCRWYFQRHFLFDSNFSEEFSNFWSFLTFSQNYSNLSWQIWCFEYTHGHSCLCNALWDFLWSQVEDIMINSSLFLLYVEGGTSWHTKCLYCRLTHQGERDQVTMATDRWPCWFAVGWIKGLRPVLWGFVVTMHECACETGSPTLRLLGWGIVCTICISSSAL